VLSGAAGEWVPLRCFEAGCDDFQRKPVSYLELRARVRAIVRRTSPVTGKRPRRVGALAIDPGALEAHYAGTRLELSRLEFALLCQLASDPLRVFTKRELLRDVWGYRADARTRTLDAHACRLRRKLHRAGAAGHVVNLRGLGYRLVDRVPELLAESGRGRQRARATARRSRCGESAMRRSGPLRRGKRLARRTALRRSAPLRRKSPLRRSPVSPASRTQRDKVRAAGCLLCGARPADPAHLVPRSLGGCDHADCVVPLCRAHHRRYDRGELDLLAAHEPRFRGELAHGLLHVSLLRLLRRVSATRWEPANAAGRGIE